MDLQGKRIRLNTSREGKFQDDLSGIHLDIWDRGTMCTIPKDISDEKLKNIALSLRVGILFLEDDVPESIQKLDEERDELSSILKGSVGTAGFSIRKINDVKSLDFLESLEKSAAGRKGVLNIIQERREKLASGNVTARRESGAYQISNIAEKK